MVSSLQVYVPFKLNFIQHILFMPIIIKAIKKLLYLCFCSYRIPLVHPLANRSNTAAFSSFCHGWSYDGTKNNVHTPAAVGTKEAKQEHQKTPPTTSRSLLPNTETSASQEVRIRRIPEHQTRLPTEAVTLWRPGAHFNFPPVLVIRCHMSEHSSHP